MKNDIDSILDSMFRGGTLRFKSGESGKETPPGAGRPKRAGGPALPGGGGAGGGQPVPVPPAEHRAPGPGSPGGHGRFRAPPAPGRRGPPRLWRATAGAPGGAGPGLPGGPAGGGGPGAGPGGVFGQLLLAFKRPLWRAAKRASPCAGRRCWGPTAPAGTAPWSASPRPWGDRGVLKSPKAVFLDLSRYGAADSEKLFVQDLYAALKSGALRPGAGALGAGATPPCSPWWAPCSRGGRCPSPAATRSRRGCWWRSALPWCPGRSPAFPREASTCSS